MGYLFSNLPFGKNIVRCTDLYIYAMKVNWRKADQFSALLPESTIALAIQAVLPDVEDWQVSVIKVDKRDSRNGKPLEGHVKFRFHDQAQRALAQNALLNVGFELVIGNVTLTTGD